MLKSNAVKCIVYPCTTKTRCHLLLYCCVFLYTGGPKRKPQSFCYNCIKYQHLQNLYTGTLSNKFAIVTVLKILPHLKCSTTLLCEILLSAFEYYYLHGNVVISRLEASMGPSAQELAETDHHRLTLMPLLLMHFNWLRIVRHGEQLQVRKAMHTMMTNGYRKLQ